MISVTKTVLPTIEEYNKYLKHIWDTNWLTNNGELVRELEAKLAERFGVKHVLCVDHGTSAIMLALRALGIKKEIYVSPDSFISTVSAPVWMGIKPVFVDEGEEYQGPALVTHVYGIPRIVNVHPVIYDASHCFPVMYEGKSILQQGEVSIISFHATKTFQTAEGGAVVTNDDSIAEKISWMRNTGFRSQYFKSGKKRYDIMGTGLNCKMSEFHAAMGLCSLKTVDRTAKRLQEIITRYNEGLGLDCGFRTYYPYWYPSEKKLLKALKVFEKYRIFPRRYFYPPLNKVFKGKPCPIAEDLMSRVICLPMYYDLKDEEVDQIIQIVKETV